MGSHILLKIEVSKLLTLLQLQQLEQLGVGVNLATIVLVLKLLSADVSIDLTSHLSAGKNTTLGLTQESGQLVGNQSGLDETRRRAIDVVLRRLLALLAARSSRAC